MMRVLDPFPCCWRACERRAWGMAALCYAPWVMTPEEVLAAVGRVLQGEAHLRWAYVFGSVARGQRYRDVDVAVMPSTSMPSSAVLWGQLIGKLEAAVGTKVDLVDLTHAEMSMVGPMLRERRVVLDAVPDLRRTWEAEVTSRWLDFEPCYEEFLRRRSEAMRQRVQQGG